MKKSILVARILLGFVFLASGLLAILHPGAPPPTTPADALAFVNILHEHHYMTFVALLMVIAGVLLLVGRYVPLALVILGPILVNILLFHLLLDPAHLANAIPGLVCTLLELFLLWAYRLSFRGLFDAAPEVS